MKQTSWTLLAGVIAAAALHTAAAGQTPDPATFPQYLAGLWPAAEAKGVNRATFDRVVGFAKYDPKIVGYTERQAEFSQPIWVYLAGALAPARIDLGRRQYEAARDTLKLAKEKYGVDAGAIMGVWGVESEFGGAIGGVNILSALATLGFIHYQGDLGGDELIAAMRIIEAGDVSPSAMRGSWAGAMGQPQFMPSSYLEYAVDFDGHGRRDIWTDKADALGSIANFLAKHGWTPDLPWMQEVALPHGYTFSPADFSGKTTFAEFAEKGLRRADGGALTGAGAARLFMPAGIGGPALLITHNFDVIKTYNNSNAYVLAAGLLGDMIVGRPGLKAPWPKGERGLTREELKQVQAELKTKGFEIGEVDGRAGPKLEAAVRAYQFKESLIPDGYASPALLKRLQAPS